MLSATLSCQQSHLIFTATLKYYSNLPTILSYKIHLSCFHQFLFKYHFFILNLGHNLYEFRAIHLLIYSLIILLQYKVYFLKGLHTCFRISIIVFVCFVFFEDKNYDHISFFLSPLIYEAISFVNVYKRYNSYLRLFVCLFFKFYIVCIIKLLCFLMRTIYFAN